MLHLLSTSENLKWVRCPVCFDSVNERHLKAVKWLDEPIYTEEDHDDHSAEASSSASGLDYQSTTSTLRMRLMQRPQITTLALPRSSTWPSDLLPPHQAPFHFLPDVFAFSKFMLATPDYLINDLSRDLDEVAAERRTMISLGDELALIFVDSAEQKLRHQIEKASALDTESLRDTIEKVTLTQQKLQQQAIRAAEVQRKAENSGAALSDAPDAFLSQQPQAQAQGVNRNSRQRRNVNPPPPSTQTYYYYQAASGLPIFLHPLDIKTLISHFNSYASFPDVITVRVESHSEGTVNDDLRKRCKYLAHFPEGADVVFVEADLEAVVGAEGIKSFESALKMRRSRRKEKGRKDDKARSKAEEREKERLATSFSFSDPMSPYRLPPTPPPVDEDDNPVPAQESVPIPTGAWGNRSFASALHAAPPPGGRPRQAQASRMDERDEYDLDVAWHELEQRSTRSGGGGKKKNSRMVVLGGGGGRRR